LERSRAAVQDFYPSQRDFDFGEAIAEVDAQGMTVNLWIRCGQKIMNSRL